MLVKIILKSVPLFFSHFIGITIYGVFHLYLFFIFLSMTKLLSFLKLHVEDLKY